MLLPPVDNKLNFIRKRFGYKIINNKPILLTLINILCDEIPVLYIIWAANSMNISGRLTQIRPIIVCCKQGSSQKKLQGRGTDKSEIASAKHDAFTRWGLGPALGPRENLRSSQSKAFSETFL